MSRDGLQMSSSLVVLHLIGFVVTYTTPSAAAGLALIPGMALSEPWRLLTFQFIHGGMISFFFSTLILWVMARPLEESWGTPRFFAFWLISVLVAAGTALLLGGVLAGDVFLTTSLLFTFATVHPDHEFLLFFVLPVKVKYLALLGVAYLLYTSAAYGLVAGAVNVLGMSAGYLFFLATRRLPSRRKIAFELKQRSAARSTRSEAAAAGERNLEWDPRVRAAEGRARAAGEVAAEDLPLLQELDAAVDPSVTVCAPEEFGYVEDEVCRRCPGYAECAARRIRMAAGEEGEATDGGRS